MALYKKFTFCFLFLYAFTCNASPIIVDVSDQYSEIFFAELLSIKPGKQESLQLNNPNNGDTFKVQITPLDGPLNIVAIDLESTIAQNSKPISLFDVTITQKWEYEIDLKNRKSIVLIITNKTGILQKRAESLITRQGTRDLKTRLNYKFRILPLVDALDAYYKLPAFKITIAPCGTKNAFSSPDVLICTELIAELFRKNADEAIHAVVLHEIAHTLLGIWDFPGANNEDMADEFAAMYLATSAPNSLKKMSQWLQGNDSVTAALFQLIENDRHSLPIQRARNINAILENPQPIIKRWSKLLKEYAKPIKLQNISFPENVIQDPGTIIEGKCYSLLIPSLSEDNICGAAKLAVLRPVKDRFLIIYKTALGTAISIAGTLKQTMEMGDFFFDVDSLWIDKIQYSTNAHCRITDRESKFGDINCFGKLTDSSMLFEFIWSPSNPWIIGKPMKI